MKKLNFITACLVAIALALLIALAVRRLAPGGGDEPPPVSQPPVSASAPTAAPSGESPSGAPAGTGQGEAPEETPEDPAPQSAPPPVEGERFTVEAPYAERLSMTVDTGRYTRENMEDGDQYYLSSDESRAVFIEIVFKPGSVSELKPSFLDAYLPGFTDMENLGEVRVASSPVVGEGVTVTDGSSTFDAWLIEVESGFFAVVAGYKTQEQGGELYRMLDTLTFEP